MGLWSKDPLLVVARGGHPLDHWIRDVDEWRNSKG